MLNRDAAGNADLTVSAWTAASQHEGDTDPVGLSLVELLPELGTVHAELEHTE